MSRTEKQSHPILGAVEEIVRLSRFVHIDYNRVQALAPGVAATFTTSNWLASAPETVRHTLDGLSLAEQITFMIVFHSAGFCYWGAPLWFVEEDGRQLNGSMAWLSVLSAGEELRSLKFLADMTPEAFDQITRGAGDQPMPLAAERLSLLNKLGKAWADNEEKLLERCTASSGALDLAFWIGEQLPGFDDRTKYDNITVNFLKRAQLLASDISFLREKAGLPPLSCMDELTACADYKIPQLLRHAGLLEYTPELAAKVDNKEEIASLSREEIEIRAATVAAVERIKEAVQNLGRVMTSVAIDNIIWLLAQDLNAADGTAERQDNTMLPYHRCRTIYY